MPEQNIVVCSPFFLSLQSSNVWASVAMAESITDEKMLIVLVKICILCHTEFRSRHPKFLFAQQDFVLCHGKSVRKYGKQQLLEFAQLSEIKA